MEAWAEPCAPQSLGGAGVGWGVLPASPASGAPAVLVSCVLQRVTLVPAGPPALYTSSVSYKDTSRPIQGPPGNPRWLISPL